MVRQLAEPVSVLEQRAATTTVAEAERPDVLLLVMIACAATDGDVWSAWVADAGCEPLLVGAFDKDRIPRSTAEYMIGRRYGVPRRVVVVDFQALATEQQVTEAAAAARTALWGGQ